MKENILLTLTIASLALSNCGTDQTPAIQNNKENKITEQTQTVVNHNSFNEEIIPPETNINNLDEGMINQEYDASENKEEKTNILEKAFNFVKEHPRLTAAATTGAMTLSALAYNYRQQIKNLADQICERVKGLIPNTNPINSYELATNRLLKALKKMQKAGKEEMVKARLQAIKTRPIIQQNNYFQYVDVLVELFKLDENADLEEFVSKMISQNGGGDQCTMSISDFMKIIEPLLTKEM